MSGRDASNVAIAVWLADALPSRTRASRSSSFSLPPRRLRPGDPAVLQDHLGGVARADAHLLELLSLGDPRRALGHDEARLSARAELGIDRRDDHVQVREPAVGDPGLRAVEHPLVGRLVVDRARPQARDVRAGVGLGHAERRELEVPGRAEALRDPLHRCSGVPAFMIPATASVEPKIARQIPASPHDISSNVIAIDRPVGSANVVAMKSRS